MSKQRLPFGLPQRQKRSPVYEIAMECGAQGVKAFNDGILIDENPWPSGSINARAWAEGWEAGYDRASRLGMVIE